jgi:hypothetical protein
MVSQWKLNAPAWSCIFLYSTHVNSIFVVKSKPRTNRSIHGLASTNSIASDTHHKHGNWNPQLLSFLCMYVCLYVCLYVCTYVRMYVYIIYIYVCMNNLPLEKKDFHCRAYLLEVHSECNREKQVSLSLQVSSETSGHHECRQFTISSSNYIYIILCIYM